jgi:hypothetical protein
MKVTWNSQIKIRSHIVMHNYSVKFQNKEKICIVCTWHNDKTLKKLPDYNIIVKQIGFYYEQIRIYSNMM